MHGWHCYIFKTYPPDKLSKLRTTGPRLIVLCKRSFRYFYTSQSLP